MDRSAKWKIVAAGVAGLALAGGGAAIAASKLGSPSQESQAIVNDAAQQLGIEPSKLSAALKKALEDRVDAAVAAGRITKAEGDALKARIERDDFPIFGGLRHGPGCGYHDLDAAATYLGLTEDQLRAQLEGGKTLAQVAKDQGKSVDGLVDALVAEAKEHLDDAVAKGRLTKAQEESILADVKQRITDFVNGKGPSRSDFRRFRGGPAFRSFPPPFDATPA